MSALVLMMVAEAPLRETIAQHLQKNGLKTCEAHSIAEAVSLTRRVAPSLVILGRGDGGEAGNSLCQTLRHEGNPLIMFLGPSSSDMDVEAALDAGGDDYLTIPCSLVELTARIRALLRRRHGVGKARPEEIRVGDLSVNYALRQVLLCGELVPMAPKEYEILATLAECADRVVARDELVRQVWRGKRSIKRQTLDVYLYSLRSKIEENPTQPSRLLTVRGCGYRLAKPD